MTALRKKMQADLGLRGLAPGTRDHYLRCVKKFAEYFWRSPADLGTAEVRQFLQHLQQLGRKPPTIIVYWAALLFVYKVTLRRPEIMADVPRPRVPRRDPVPALTEAEVSALLDAAASEFDQTLLSVMYACGLRVSAVCALQVGDVDARARLLHIRKGKGGKSRAAPLSPETLSMLREHWRRHRPRQPWLFPARRLVRPGVWQGDWADHPVDRKTIGDRFRKTVKRANLRRHVTLHDLRRASATRFHELGVDLRDIQVLLGHASPETTARYVAISPDQIARLPCLLERLKKK